jgi:hypothetical protein
MTLERAKAKPNATCAAVTPAATAMALAPGIANASFNTRGKK